MTSSPDGPPVGFSTDPSAAPPMPELGVSSTAPEPGDVTPDACRPQMIPTSWHVGLMQNERGILVEVSVRTATGVFTAFVLPADAMGVGMMIAGAGAAATQKMGPALVVAGSLDGLPPAPRV
jgi:hypothetical protein